MKYQSVALFISILFFSCTASAAQPVPGSAENMTKAPVQEQAMSSQEIKRGTEIKGGVVADTLDTRLNKLEFKKAKMADVMRTLSEMSSSNIVVTNLAGELDVTIFLKNISIREAIEIITKNSGAWFRQDRATKTYRIMTTDEFQQDMVIYRDDATRVFNLLHPNPVVVATAIQDLYGPRVLMTLGVVSDDFGLGAGSSIASGSGAGGGGAGAATGRAGGGAAGAGFRRGGTTAAAGRAGAAGATTTQKSEQAVTEKLTADQLSKVESVQQVGADGNVISSDALRGITSSEQPIYLTVNREHNLIIVRTGDTAAMRDVEKLIKEMDRPTPQVLLEMKILELKVGDSYSKLFNLDFNSASGRQALGLGNVISATTGSFIYNFINDRITASLELLEKNNQINNLSSPILMASNNRPARVFVGEERVLVTGVNVTDPVLGAGNVVITPGRIEFETETRDIGITLNILPKINADKTVTLSIQQDSSSVLVGAVTLPPITVGNAVQNFRIDSVKTANIEGIVVARDGLTVAIGGLISRNRSNDETKVPFFSDLPLVGGLFGSKTQSDEKNELVLLITPRIITNPSDAEDVSRDSVEPLSVQDW